MLILSIDSASSGCAVALWRDGQVLEMREERMERGQDARLVPMVQEAMQATGLNYADIDRIAVTRGPGSFTGIRIGLAMARGLALASGKPVIGIDRFALWRAQHTTGDVLVALDSRRLELYVKSFGGDGPTGMAQMLTPEEIVQLLQQNDKMLVAGDALGILGEMVRTERRLMLKEPEVVTAARLASQAEANDPAFAPMPLYIRPPDVTIKPCTECS